MAQPRDFGGNSQGQSTESRWEGGLWDVSAGAKHGARCLLKVQEWRDPAEGRPTNQIGNFSWVGGELHEPKLLF